MLGIYLLVTLFCQLSSESLFLAFESGPGQVAVDFQQLNGITVGTPVIADGQLIGSVARIVSPDDKGKDAAAKQDAASVSAYTVQLKIAPTHRGLLRRGTVGLITAPVSTFKTSPETVVELILPSKAASPLLKEGDKITGYSSFTDFWRGNSVSEASAPKQAPDLG